jgi:hypothetical protein
MTTPDSDQGGSGNLAADLLGDFASFAGRKGIPSP